MNETLNSQLDAWALCRKGEALHGRFPLADIESLNGIVKPNEHTHVEVCLTFDQDEESYKTVRVEAKILLELTCERCLLPFSMPIETENTLALCTSIEHTKHLPEQYEPIIVPNDGLLCVAKLLGEEILLALPLIRRHEDENCSIHLTYLKDEQPQPSTYRPFEKLAN